MPIEIFQNIFKYLSQQWKDLIKKPFEDLLRKISSLNPNNQVDAAVIQHEWGVLEQEYNSLFYQINLLVPDYELNEQQQGYKTAYANTLKQNYFDAQQIVTVAILNRKEEIQNNSVRMTSFQPFFAQAQPQYVQGAPASLASVNSLASPPAQQQPPRRETLSGYTPFWDKDTNYTPLSLQDSKEIKIFLDVFLNSRPVHEKKIADLPDEYGTPDSTFKL